MTPPVGPRLYKQTAMRDSDRHGEGGRMSATEQDRKRAAEVLYPGLFAKDAEARHPGQIERTAAALADERERAHAAAYAQGRVEELELMAEVLESKPPLIRAYSNSRRSIARSLRSRADLIRRAAEDPQ